MGDEEQHKNEEKSEKKNDPKVGSKAVIGPKKRKLEVTDSNKTPGKTEGKAEATDVMESNSFLRFLAKEKGKAHQQSMTDSSKEPGVTKGKQEAMDLIKSNSF